MISKKDKLIKLMQQGDISEFSIVGIPRNELIIAVRNNKLVELLTWMGLEHNSLSKFDIDITFPKLDGKECKFICAINISGTATIEEIDILKGLVEEVLEYYQVKITNNILLKLTSLDEGITFEDILTLIPETQADISKNTGIFKQTLTNIKNGSRRMTMTILIDLLKKYPLLPWDHYILSCNERE